MKRSLTPDQRRGRLVLIQDRNQPSGRNLQGCGTLEHLSRTRGKNCLTQTCPPPRNPLRPTWISSACLWGVTAWSGACRKGTPTEPTPGWSQGCRAHLFSPRRLPSERRNGPTGASTRTQRLDCPTLGGKSNRSGPFRCRLARPGEREGWAVSRLMFPASLFITRFQRRRVKTSLTPRRAWSESPSLVLNVRASWASAPGLSSRSWGSGSRTAASTVRSTCSTETGSPGMKAQRWHFK